VLGPSGGNVDGTSVDGTTVLVKFTYGGDANLDGKINIDDYVKIDNGIASGLSGWANGDFNYDGKVNIDDYVIIDSNIVNQGPPLAAGSDAGQISWISPARLMWDSSRSGERLRDLLDSPDAIV
jgi:hypothetical protein